MLLTFSRVFFTFFAFLFGMGAFAFLALALVMPVFISISLATTAAAFIFGTDLCSGFSTTITAVTVAKCINSGTYYYCRHRRYNKSSSITVPFAQLLLTHIS